MISTGTILILSHYLKISAMSYDVEQMLSVMMKGRRITRSRFIHLVDKVSLLF